MQGWSAALTEAIVESYSGIAPLAPEQRRLIPAVAALDLVARVAWLLNLAYLDDRMIDDPAMPVLRSGVKTLLNSLEVLTGILAPEATHRRWVKRGTRPEDEAGGRVATASRRYGQGRPRTTGDARPGSSKRQRDRE
jgi:hypothetical protein